MVPLFDTAFVVATRLLEGRPATRGGRDHTSHRLAEIGLGEGGAVALLVGAAVLAGLPLLAAQVLGWAVAATLLGLVVLALAGLGWGLTRVGTQGRVP